MNIPKLAIITLLLLLIFPGVMAAVFPSADFSANATGVCVYDIIQFTDTSESTGTIIAWFWLFGDSQDSHIQNPTHYYDIAGVYDVSLWVQDEWGSNTTIKYEYITVIECFLSDFAANKTCQIGKPLSVQFNSSCPYPYKNLWYFGDGNTSDIQNPINTYYEYGSYTVEHMCDDPILGTVSTSKPDYIRVGVNGTYCYGKPCAANVACDLEKDSPFYMLLAGMIIIVMAIVLLYALKRKKI